MMNLSSASLMLAYICIHINDASATALTAIDQSLSLPPGVVAESVFMFLNNKGLQLSR